MNTIESIATDVHHGVFSVGVDQRQQRLLIH